MPVEKLDIYCTPYVINIANALKEILIEINIITNVYCRKINNEDIERCRNDKNLFMFLFCPQWVCSDNGRLNKDLRLPYKKYYFYQLEQFDRSDSLHTRTNGIIKMMNNAKHIFDYSKINLEYYTKQPFNLKRKDFSYLIPSIPQAIISENKDIDVLFVGAISRSRRKDILSCIKDNDINLKIVTKCFGTDLTKLISRSKIFLNIRYSNSKILETCRLHEALLSSNTIIVSEKPTHDIEKEYIEMYGNRIRFINQITNDSSQLIKLLKILLSLYDKSKHIEFDTNKINSEIKNTISKTL